MRRPKDLKRRQVKKRVKKAKINLKQTQGETAAWKSKETKLLKTKVGLKKVFLKTIC